jgi:hypothetical protein
MVWESSPPSTSIKSERRPDAAVSFTISPYNKHLWNNSVRPVLQTGFAEVALHYLYEAGLTSSVSESSKIV